MVTVLNRWSLDRYLKRRSRPDATAARRAAKAPLGMVVDDAHGLQEGIDDGRADEAEAAQPQVLRYGIAEWRVCRYAAWARTIHHRPAAHERPQVAIEGAEFALQGEKGLRIGYGGLDLQPVAHDAGVAPQRCTAPRIEARHAMWVEAGEGGPVAGALAQNG